MNMDVTICLKKPFKLSLDGTCKCAWRTSFPCETVELSVKCHRSTGDVSKINFFQAGNDTHSKQLHDINKSHSVRRDYQVFAEPSTVLTALWLGLYVELWLLKCVREMEVVQGIFKIREAPVHCALRTWCPNHICSCRSKSKFCVRVRVHVRFHKLKGILLFLPHSSGQYLLRTWLQLSGDVGLKVCAAVCQIDLVCAFKCMCVCDIV